MDDQSQRPIAGAEITLLGMSRPMIRPLESGPPVAVTDGDGRYRFQNVEAGRYRMMVQKTGYARLDGPDGLEVALTPGVQQQTFNVALKKGAVIAGHVLDENGDPVIDTQVMVLRRPPAHFSGKGATADLSLFPSGQVAQTNDLGEFRVFGLLPHDAYFVRALPRPRFERPAVARTTVSMPTYFPAALDWHAAQPVALRAGETSADLVIRMINLPAFRVGGVVIDAGGQPVANALVRLSPDDPKDVFVMGQPPYHTDLSGRFTIDGVTAGNYTLIAIAPVVTARPPSHAQGGANGGSFTFSSGLVGGVVSGGVGGGVITEMRDGVTTEYRDDAGTRVPVAIDQTHVEGLEITVQRSQRPR